MTRPRTVLQVLPRLITGGVERGTVEIAAALTAAGWRAVVASAGGPMAKEIERVGGKHVILPLASKNPFVMWRNIQRLVNLIGQYKVDIVHARSRAPAWSAYAAAHHSNRPFITTFHNAYGGSSALKRAYNSVMARGERVIAISQFVAEYAEKIYGVPHDILRMIPRGVDVKRFDRAQVSEDRLDRLRQTWSVPEGHQVIMLPGRLSRWKGHEIFIEALAMLPHKNVTALIVGSGDKAYRDELQARVTQRNLDDTIHFVDECRDMPAAFCLADIVVSASTRPEGFGRVIVEAQAMGCPVIATEHGGARETIIDGETGWLIPPAKAGVLAEAISVAMKQPPDERARMGERAITHVRADFTTALMAARTLAVYEEVLPTR